MHSFYHEDEESLKIHIPYLYYILCEKLVDMPSTILVQLIQKVCYRLNSSAMTTVWYINDFRRRPVKNQVSSYSVDTNVLFASPVEVESTMSPMLPSPFDDEGLDGWVVNTKDISTFYLSQDVITTKTSNRLLDRIQIGKPAISSAFKSIKKYLVKLSESVMTGAASMEDSSSFLSITQIISYHLRNSTDTISDIHQLLKRCILQTGQFDIIKACTDLILFNRIDDVEFIHQLLGRVYPLPNHLALALSSSPSFNASSIHFLYYTEAV